MVAHEIWISVNFTLFFHIFLFIFFDSPVCSINLEWLHGDLAAKYVLKYITKGGDAALVLVKGTNDGEIIVNYDEFEEIRLAVYRTASEAMLAIYGHKIFTKSFPVEVLYVHRDNEVSGIVNVI